MSGGDYSTAIAAAVFAINSIEESTLPAQGKTSEGHDTLSTKFSGKLPDKSGVPEKALKSALSIRRVPASTDKSSIETESGVPEKSIKSVPSLKKKLTFADELMNNSPPTREAENSGPKKDVGSAPSIRKTPTFSDDRSTSKKAGSEVPKAEKLSTEQSTFPPSENKSQGSPKYGVGNTKADVWEKAEMAKIKQRYDKSSTKLFDWESKKKKKAKRMMDEIEAELDRRRAKALQNYRNKMKSIDQIARGARAQAQENQRHEEYKAKEKANKIRSTGKLPATCLCF